MKDYGKVRSTIKPETIVIDAYSVWVHSDIEEIEENNGFKEFEYKMIQYSKDEFILLQFKKNNDLESQINTTQLALTEVYELFKV